MTPEPLDLSRASVIEASIDATANDDATWTVHFTLHVDGDSVTDSTLLVPLAAIAQLAEIARAGQMYVEGSPEFVAAAEHAGDLIVEIPNDPAGVEL